MCDMDICSEGNVRKFGVGQRAADAPTARVQYLSAGHRAAGSAAPVEVELRVVTSVYVGVLYFTVRGNCV